jgi:hypothetical protein
MVMMEDRLPSLFGQTGVLACSAAEVQARRLHAMTAETAVFLSFCYPLGAIRFVISTANFSAAVA